MEHEPVLVLWLLLAIGCIAALRLGLHRTRPRQRRSLWAIALGSCLICLLASCGNSLPTASTASSESDTADIGTTRAIDHGMGTAQVPQTPDRVVTVDTAALDAALAVGVTPIGSIVFGAFPTYLAAQTDGIVSVGDGNQPNLEAILQLNPDLILGTKIGTESLYPRLSNIAPTVLSEGSGRSGEWQDTFRLYAEALGRPDEAERVLQDYQQQVDDLRQRLGDTENTIVSVLATGQGQIGFYGENSFSGSVLQDVGFSRPPAQARSPRWAEMVSREDLESLDGDIIFLITSQQFPGSMTKQEFVADPVWSQLEAVQQDHVYEVEDEIWIMGRNILAARRILDDIAQAVESSERS